MATVLSSPAIQPTSRLMASLSPARPHSQSCQVSTSSRSQPEALSSLHLSRASDIAALKNAARRGKLSAKNAERVFGVFATADVAQLRGAKEAIKELITSKSCSPILIRLGWHDSGTYDKNISEWPKHGGADGSLRFKPELDHAANAGLLGALDLLEPIKVQYPNVSYADLFQLASATAIEVAGGPKIPMRYGRVDVSDSSDCPSEGNLPDAGPPNPAEHLRKVFYRMGLNDQEIVALSGAHTLGRSRPERSGWGKKETKYTKNGPGAPGGQSWTVDWLKFDNSYFKDVKAKKDEDLLVLPTDAALFDDPSFKVYAEKYAQDESAFFADYALAHKRLSELGSKFDPPEGVLIDQPQPEKFVAAKYSSGQKELSPEMKERLRKEYVGFGGSPNEPLQTNYFLNIIIAISILAILTKLTGAI